MRNAKNETLLEVIERRTVKVPFSGCWLWMGALNRGYGQLNFGKMHLKAHAASYAAHNPDAPKPVCVCHHCDVKSCVNPDHLYGGDHRTNRIDAIERGQWKSYHLSRTACGKGHEYVDGSYRRDARDGSRVCLVCKRQSTLKYLAKRKEQS